MIYILLPAYNEEESLDDLIPGFDALMRKENQRYRIIACNDGSVDRTHEKLVEAAQTYPVTIIDHKINRGLGETVRDLFETAAEMAQDDDILVRLDCDSTHKPEYVRGLIKKLNEGYDMVIASRFVPGGGQEGLDRYRATISMLANKFMKVFFPIQGLQEYSCGYRAYRASIIKKAIRVYGNDFIQLKGLGFTCTLEKVIKLHLLGAKIGEAPFVLRYDQKKGVSKMVSSVTTLGYMVMVILHYWPWGGWISQKRRRLDGM